MNLIIRLCSCICGDRLSAGKDEISEHKKGSKLVADVNVQRQVAQSGREEFQARKDDGCLSQSSPQPVPFQKTVFTTSISKAQNPEVQTASQENVFGGCSETSQAWEQLSKTCEEFELCYGIFARSRHIPEQVDSHAIVVAVQQANDKPDIEEAGQFFGDVMSKISHTIQEERQVMENSWRGKIGTALARVYPFVRIAFGVTNFAADVYPLAI